VDDERDHSLPECVALPSSRAGEEGILGILSCKRPCCRACGRVRCGGSGGGVS